MSRFVDWWLRMPAWLRRRSREPGGDAAVAAQQAQAEVATSKGDAEVVDSVLATLAQFDNQSIEQLERSLIVAYERARGSEAFTEALTRAMRGQA